MAILAIPLFIFLVGVWEVGRMIQVTQLLSNAAREGARQAAQGQIIHFDPTKGGFTYSQIYVYPQTGANAGAPNVSDTVRNYLANAGINTTGIPDASLVQYVNNGQPNPPPLPNPPPSPTPDPTQPWGAAKNDRLSVTVTVPYDRVRWTTLSLINPSTLRATVDCFGLRDDWFAVDVNLPTWAGY